MLEHKALKRLTSGDAGLSERGVALLTAAAMRAKRKLGLGLSLSKTKRVRKTKSRKKSGKGLKQRTVAKKKLGKGLSKKCCQLRVRKNKKIGRGLSFNKLVKIAKKSLKNVEKHRGLDHFADKALGAVRREIKKKKVLLPRIISVPKSGNGLALIPILAAISTLGGAASGVRSIVQAVSDIVDAERKMFPGEQKQVNNGLYLAPYKKNGLGLYLAPPYQPKN